LILINFLIRVFVCPDTFHETLLERDEIRSAVLRATLLFFTQQKDDVMLVNPPSPLELYDPEKPLFSLGEIIVRSAGIAAAGVGVVVGLSMMFGSRRALGKIFNFVGMH
jgi:hypothetical protein